MLPADTGQHLAAARELLAEYLHFDVRDAAMSALLPYFYRTR